MVFRRTWLDYSISLIALGVFLWAFFIDSFTPYRDANGTILRDYVGHPYTRINLQVILGPLIIIYEMFQIYVLPGHRQGRELPWRLYFQIAKEKVRNKLSSGLQEYHDWRKH